MAAELFPLYDCWITATGPDLPTEAEDYSPRKRGRKFAASPEQGAAQCVTAYGVVKRTARMVVESVLIAASRSPACQVLEQIVAQMAQKLGGDDLRRIGHETRPARMPLGWIWNGCTDHHLSPPPPIKKKTPHQPQYDRPERAARR